MATACPRQGVRGYRRKSRPRRGVRACRRGARLRPGAGSRGPCPCPFPCRQAMGPSPPPTSPCPRATGPRPAAGRCRRGPWSRAGSRRPGARPRLWVGGCRRRSRPPPLVEGPRRGAWWSEGGSRQRRARAAVFAGPYDRPQDDPDGRRRRVSAPLWPPEGTPRVPFLFSPRVRFRSLPVSGHPQEFRHRSIGVLSGIRPGPGRRLATCSGLATLARTPPTGSRVGAPPAGCAAW